MIEGRGALEKRGSRLVMCVSFNSGLLKSAESHMNLKKGGGVHMKNVGFKDLHIKNV